MKSYGKEDDFTPLPPLLKRDPKSLNTIIIKHLTHFSLMLRFYTPPPPPLWKRNIGLNWVDVVRDH